MQSSQHAMKKYIILYYSKTGNSGFMAEKLSRELSCDMEMIRPMLNYTGLLFLISMLKIPIPTNISTKKIEQYQEIIVIGPIWGGLLIAPLRSILKKCFKLSKSVHFAVTCDTSEDDKDYKYGYAQVLQSAVKLGGQLVRTTAAFSTSLIKGHDGKINTDINVKAKFMEENYNDELKKRLHDFKSAIGK
jgi:flavodoxin